MQDLLEAPVAGAQVLVGTTAPAEVAKSKQQSQTQKARLRFRFAAAFILVMVFAPTLAAFIWTYLQRRY